MPAEHTALEIRSSLLGYKMVFLGGKAVVDAAGKTAF